MTDIAFCSSVPQIAGLRALLQAQRIQLGDADDGPCHTLIVGDLDSATSALVTRAKRCGAKRIVALETDAPDWSFRDELGGSLVRVAMPKRAGSPDRNGALFLLAHLLVAPFDCVLTADPKSRELVDLAARVARHDVSVFINGPTGSGKEVLSRFIHASSTRANGPFIALNCAAIPENMLEAMLFGHEKGAFTGAANANKGYVRAAAGGTLLLDEISEMPLGLQSKLLRVIQEKSVTPVGSQAEVPVDVRFIATSNRDMQAEVRLGTFREDLFFRLNVFPLATLPLASRPRDIPYLAQSLLVRHAQGVAPRISEAAFDVLLAHDWPGNVRELENVMQRALVLADGPNSGSENRPEIAAEHIIIAPVNTLARSLPRVPDAADLARQAA